MQKKWLERLTNDMHMPKVSVVYAWVVRVIESRFKERLQSADLLGHWTGRSAGIAGWQEDVLTARRA